MKTPGLPVSSAWSIIEEWLGFRRHADGFAFASECVIMKPARLKSEKKKPIFRLSECGEAGIAPR